MCHHVSLAISSSAESRNGENELFISMRCEKGEREREREREKERERERTITMYKASAKRLRCTSKLRSSAALPSLRATASGERPSADLRSGLAPARNNGNTNCCCCCCCYLLLFAACETTSTNLCSVHVAGVVEYCFA
jgi:hypothetical protein